MVRISLSFVGKFFIGIGIGVYLALSGLRSSGHLEHFFRIKINNFFEDKYKSSLSVEGMDISIVPLSLKIKTLNVDAQEQDWSLTAQNITLSIDFFSSLVHKKIVLTTLCEKCSFFCTEKTFKQIASSNVTQQMPLRTFPLYVQSCSLDSFYIKAMNEQNTSACIISGSASLLQKQKNMLATITIHNGSITHKDIENFHHIAGSIEMIYDPHTFKIVSIDKKSSLSTHLHMPHCSSEVLILQGSWMHNTGSLFLTSTNPAITALAKVTFNDEDNYLYTVNAQLPIAYGALLKNIPNASLIKGTLSINAKGTQDKQASTLVLSNVGWNTMTIDQIICNVDTENALTSGEITIIHKGKKINGTGFYNHTSNYFSGKFNNTELFSFSNQNTWTIQPNDLSFSLIYNPTTLSTLEHQATIINKDQDITITTKGTLTLDSEGKIKGSGSCNALSYILKNDEENNSALYSLHVTHQNKSPLFSLFIDTNAHTFKETIHFEILRRALIYLYDYPITGQGKIHLEGHWQDNAYNATLTSDELLIRLPEMYNFITRVTGSLEGTFFPFYCKAQDVSLFLNKGVITSHEIQCEINKTFTITNFFIPLHFRKCFINWKDQFIGTITGSYIFKKNHKKQSLLEGFLSIEDGLITENILALSQNQAEAEPLPLTIHSSIMTKKSIGIKSPQLQSNATGHLTIDNNTEGLALTGSLHLHGGIIQFPYKPLSIMRAEVHFSENHKNNPAIDIILQGLLKKYSVTVSVSGNAQDPQIALESTPSLNDEQIIELLLTGSTGESLSAMVPSIVMKNLESIIFGNNKQSKSTFAALMEPLKRIHFIPSFVDQSEKGGIRGAIDIEISDYLHALYQKNFNTEYTRVECEYVIGDDISLRAIKDERDDIGGEIEMRFAL